VSLNNDIAAQAKITEEQLAEYIVAATGEVFATMIGNVEIAADYPLQEPVIKFKCSVTGMVGFAGTYSGVVSLHCPVRLAKRITSEMLGMSSDEVEEGGADMHDAIGEIANMLAGSIKMVLSKGGTDVKLSVPTVISGEDYTVEILSDVDCVVIPFNVGSERFLVGLTLKNDEA